MQILAEKPGRSVGGLLLLIFCLSLPAWGAGAEVEVRRLGLSKVGNDTLLTVVLDRAAAPAVSALAVSGQPQLVVDFPQAKAGRLPTRLEGDDSLVRQVVTETTSPGRVRIILDLFPEKPYTYWKQTRPGSAGQTFFILGLKPDLKAQPVRTPVAAPPAPEPAAPPPAPRAEVQERAAVPEPPQPDSNDYGYRESQGSVAPSNFAELRRLIPRADNLLQNLETTGWVVSESNRYDRPGTRFSRDFILSNSRYPELKVKVGYLPANAPNTPNIGIIMLTTDNINSPSAREYQDLRQYSFAKIRQKYEDIGDFFDEALKPLRVKLREETKSAALRHAAVFQDFLKLTSPGDPQIVEKAMKHIQAKVSPRFEGVQYTLSEKPPVFLNLVDFLFVKVYYVDQPR